MKKKPKTRKKAGRTITAGALVLKDKAGKPRIVLDASQPGLPAIHIYGEKQSSLTLTVDRDVPRIEWRRSDGTLSIVIASGDGGCGIAMYDLNGMPCFHVEHDGEKNATLLLVIKDGKVVRQMHTGPPDHTPPAGTTPNSGPAKGGS